MQRFDYWAQTTAKKATLLPCKPLVNVLPLLKRPIERGHHDLTSGHLLTKPFKPLHQPYCRASEHRFMPVRLLQKYAPACNDGSFEKTSQNLQPQICRAQGATPLYAVSSPSENIPG
ncbi:hypothetical protein Pr1d_33820 [Bythopirellula goksoeyrii]|uniref:Uncharacterized protein n=1 Tax=Bythopirellula goksoeyrii TaxID=1400387 RepID=A0A5B9QQ30_9BACT|nr:hypothetical protein Pr1d_33820 [Bythopirellula goksoeyrii]